MNYWETITANWEPWLTVNIISGIICLVCYFWVRAGRIIWGILFIAASLINSYISWVDPLAYVEAYQSTALLSLYRNFINGWFANYVFPFVLLIGLCQMLLGVGLLVGGRLLQIALLGGILFFLGVAPLGIGSAFPATLLMALSFLLIYKQNKAVELA